jgi:2-haloacid dehalogenase
MGIATITSATQNFIQSNQTRGNMIPRKYTWLLFDADGTLFDYDQAERLAFIQSLEQFGVPFEESHLEEYQRINSALWIERELGTINLENLKARRFELFFQTIGFEYDPVLAGQQYLRNLGEQAGLLDGAEQVVKTLAREYKLAMVTNGIKEVQRRRLEKSPFEDCFKEIIISDEIGTSKPDVAYFEITFERIGQPPKAETLIIGDSLTSDMQGAINYGMDACWYNPHGKKKHPGFDMRYEIRHLNELIDLLEPNK